MTGFEGLFAASTRATEALVATGWYLVLIGIGLVLSARPRELVRRRPNRDRRVIVLTHDPLVIDLREHPTPVRMGADDRTVVVTGHARQR